MPKKTPSPPPLRAEPPAPKPLEPITLIEFVNRFVDSVTNQEQRFTWFLGAGCSISSGIKAAGGLVEKWLSELWDYQDRPGGKFDAWVGKTFPAYDADNPAALYAPVFERLHPAAAARQGEIERICEGGEPSYGYATFAQILSHPGVGQRCNTVLTTNFDDLIADALYVYGDRRSRPQVITHESLARYVRIASPRPTIVKLHGDAHLSPKNLSPEIRRLEDDVTKQLHPLLLNSGIVFVGYGGNDESIARFFEECPSGPLAQQIYWVGRHDPTPKLLKWLAERGALRVDHTDFDRLMHLLRGKFAIPHPEKGRWDRTYAAFFDRLKEFEKDVDRTPASAVKDALKQVSQEVLKKTLPSEWDYYAQTFSCKSPEKEDEIYQEGLKAYPKSALLTGMYALFLETERKDKDAAETYYKLAIEADPKHANNLGNYAVFLQNVRKEMDAADEVFKRAIEADPKHANNLGNYAVFLQNARKDMEAAETFYKRALDADPLHANNLVNYAVFLQTVRKDLAAAEVYYKRALDADPKSANGLGGYALFLQTTKKDMDVAEDYYKRSLSADPKNANNLGNYALFLQNVRKDTDAAEAMYERAIEADPAHANNLTNYAQLVLSSGRISEGLALVGQALAVKPEPGCRAEAEFYRFAHDAGHRDEALRALKSTILSGGRSPEWDFSPNIARAEKDGFTGLDLLKDLAKVISEDAAATILDKYKEWPDA